MPTGVYLASNFKWNQKCFYLRPLTLFRTGGNEDGAGLIWPQECSNGLKTDDDIFLNIFMAMRSF
jgi:hypothetical protein